MHSIVKREPDEFVRTRRDRSPTVSPIYISSSSSVDDDDDAGDEADSGCSDGAGDDGQCIRAVVLGAGESASKRKKMRSLKEIDHDLAMKKPIDVVVPVDFLTPLPLSSPAEAVEGGRTVQARATRGQFWKAGDYEGEGNRDVLTSRDGTHCVFLAYHFKHKIPFVCVEKS